MDYFHFLLMAPLWLSVVLQLLICVSASTRDVNIGENTFKVCTTSLCNDVKCGDVPGDQTPCHCDYACEFYNDCCGDFESACSAMESAESTRGFYETVDALEEVDLACISPNSGAVDAYWMIQSCPDKWKGDVVRYKCTSREPSSNTDLVLLPMSLTPVIQSSGRSFDFDLGVDDESFIDKDTDSVSLIPISVIVDFSGKSGVSIFYSENIVVKRQVTCNDGEVFDLTSDGCVAVTCADGYTLTDRVNTILFAHTVHGKRHVTKVRNRAIRHASTLKERGKELRIYWKISTLLGFTWLFGFVAAFAGVSALWYVFIILNSLQGVYIFLAFMANKRVLHLWTGVLCYRRRGGALRKHGKGHRSSGKSTTLTLVAGTVSTATDHRISNQFTTWNSSDVSKV
eukprot:XP_011671098.1 PREDICTED: uncharacterized protein LOC100889522 [Strongylocentrotus purpuratus]